MNYLARSPSNNIKRILGIDPGLRHTGWAVIDIKGREIIYIASGVINTDAKQPMTERLTLIFREIVAIVKKFEPLSSGLEETYVNKNYGSSLKLAHARAAAMVAMNSNGLDVCEYAAKTVKKTVTGSGSADKAQVSKMLSLLMPGVSIKSEDESDALAIAVCHGLCS